MNYKDGRQHPELITVTTWFIILAQTDLLNFVCPPETNLSCQVLTRLTLTGVLVFLGGLGLVSGSQSES